MYHAFSGSLVLLSPSLILLQMDYLAVAIGIINRILEDAMKGVSTSPIGISKTKAEGSDPPDSKEDSLSPVIPQMPPKELRLSIAGYARKRYVMVL